MSIVPLAAGERDPVKVANAVNQLMQGRSNACGLLTLEPGATATSVQAPACGRGACVFLFPATANAAAAAATTYVDPAAVGAQQFTVSHAHDATTDRSFYWVALG